MIKIIVTVCTLFLLAGCSAKSHFTPEKVTGKLAYTTNLKSPLIDVSRDGATYGDGMILSHKRGLLKYKIDSGYHFISDNAQSVLVADSAGSVQVVINGETRFAHKFDFALASGALQGTMAALVFSNNTLMLYDIATKQVLYKEELEPTFANDARVANPLFLNDLVIFPTLDGRLLVMDRNKKVILRDVAISNKELFNNVIFLAERDNILVAATASKVIVINPQTISTKRIDVKDVLFDAQSIYIFTKTGKIIKTDLALKEQKMLKFPFAIFSAVMGADKLYAVEKSGYVIAVDKNLDTSEVYALPDAIKQPAFGIQDRLFVGPNFLKLR